MKRLNLRWDRCIFVSALLLCMWLAGCMRPAAEPVVEQAFDIRNPQPIDYPHERISGPTEIRFLPFKYDGEFPYDIEASFGADEVEPFTVEKIWANGQPIEKYQVYNNSVNNFLCRANGVEDLSVRFLSHWETNQRFTVQVIGTTPAGNPVKLMVTGQAPDQRTTSSLTFKYHEPFFAYFHIHCYFLPQSYKPFTIESVTVNGKPAIAHLGLSDSFPAGSYRAIEKYRILKGQAGPRDRPEQIRAIQAYDAKIPTDEGFSIDFPYHWKTGDQVEVVVTGKTETGETQELTASGKATWDTVGRKGWQHSAALVVQETAGVDRKDEPVEVTLGLIGTRLTDPRRELRVVTRIPDHPDADSSDFVEVPSQVLNVSFWDDSEVPVERDAETGERIPRYIPTTTVQFVFLADMQAYEERVYLLCYGNPDADAPVYKTDLKVEGEGLGQTISTDRYRIGLSTNSSAIETVLIRGEPDILLEHKIETNGAVHWNPGVYAPPDRWVHASDWEEPNLAIQSGPIVHRIGRHADMPFVTHTAAQVTYQFFAGQPYMLCETAMRIKENIFVQALRNGEIVFNHAIVDEFVWKDELGKIQSMDLLSAPHGHILEIPPDTPWMAFISRKHGVGFAHITIDYKNINLYGDLVSQDQPYLYVQKGPWYYWSRALVYPYGHANFTRMMPVRKGNLYIENNAYLMFKLASGSDPFAEVEKYQKILTNPLRVTEHIPQDPDTPSQPIPELLTAPYFGDFDKDEENTIDKKESENDK